MRGVRRALVVAYGALLGLYPGGFRSREGGEMRQALRERLRRAEGFAAVRVGLREIIDLAVNLVPAWVDPGRRDERWAASGGGEGRRRRGRPYQAEGGMMRGVTRMTGGWMRDLSHAVRGLRRRPGFSLFVVATLGVAMGANATVFGVARQVLFEPLPFPDADELVHLRETRADGSTMSVSYLNFLDWRERSRSFESLGARAYIGLTLAGEGPAAELRGSAVTPDLLVLLGVRPLHGRLIEEQDVIREERVVVLSHGVWQEHFGEDPDVLGRTIRLADEPWEVVGVLPAELEYPMSYDVYLPITALSADDRSRRSAHPGIYVVGRLNDDVDLDEARRDMAAIATDLAGEYPESNAGDGVEVTGLMDEYVGEARPVLLLLLGAVGLVLLIACANVMNLFLARWTARRREAAVRTALGSGRAALVRGVLAEAAVLALCSGGLGLLLAHAGIALFQFLEPGDVPRLQDASVDGGVLAFTMGVALATALAAGLLPAVGIASTDPAAALRDGGARGASAGDGRFRRALVVGEVAVAVSLLAGAILMIRSVDNIMDEDPGLDLQGLVTARVPMSTAAYPESADRARFFRDLLLRVESLPGVEEVAGVDPLPLSGYNRQWTLSGEGIPTIGEEGLSVDLATVTPDYFDTMGIRLLAGRGFTGDETEVDTPVLVDRTLAERLWPGQDPLGRPLGFRNSDSRMHVVGVVAPVRHYGVTEASRHQLYVPYSASVWSLNLVVRTRGEPAGIVSALRETVTGMDPSIPLTRVATMEELHRESVGGQLLMSTMLQLFAGTAMLLALMGLYGVTSYSVSLRTREVGIRMALGARRSRVAGMITREGLALAAVGVGLGVVGGLFGSRLLSGLLFGVGSTDAGTYVAVALITLVVCAAAAAIPALRATRIDPARVLQGE